MALTGGGCALRWCSTRRIGTRGRERATTALVVVEIERGRGCGVGWMLKLDEGERRHKEREWTGRVGIFLLLFLIFLNFLFSRVWSGEFRIEIRVSRESEKAELGFVKERKKRGKR